MVENHSFTRRGPVTSAKWVDGVGWVYGVRMGRGEDDEWMWYEARELLDD